MQWAYLVPGWTLRRVGHDLFDAKLRAGRVKIGKPDSGFATTDSDAATNVGRRERDRFGTIPRCRSHRRHLGRQTERQKNRHLRHSQALTWLAWIVACFSGWNCHYRSSGPKTMRAAWAQLEIMLIGEGFSILCKP